MNFFSLIAGSVFAAEFVLSPIPDDINMMVQPIPANISANISRTTFGDLIHSPIDAAVPNIELPDIKPPTSNLPPLTSNFPLPASTPSPSPKPMRTTKKSIVTIALLGDSMTDTLGPDAPHLKQYLSSIYPGTTFNIKNYGVGGTNIEYGIERITNAYQYLGNNIPSLVSQKPDMVVVESFGYNPFPVPDALNRHWLDLAKTVDTVTAAVPDVKIVIAATIAPNSVVFGDGAPGIAFSPEDKKERTDIIKSYLENAVKFAKGEHLPLADAYHASLTKNGDGNLTYINGGDHIHYSDNGRLLFAQKIGEAILNNKLLE